MMTLDDVRDIASRLPAVEESTSYGTPAFKARGKLLARLHEDGESLVLRIDHHERESLVQDQPGIYTVTDHYREWPFVLVELSSADPEEFEELLLAAWYAVTPKRLHAQFESGRAR